MGVVVGVICHGCCIMFCRIYVVPHRPPNTHTHTPKLNLRIYKVNIVVIFFQLQRSLNGNYIWVDKAIYIS